MRIGGRFFEEGLKILEMIKNPFRRYAEPASPGVKDEIFRRLETGITTERDQKVFPFKRIEICLQPWTKRIAREFKTDFMENSSLKSGIIGMLKDIPVQLQPDLEISVELQENVAPGGKGKSPAPLFEMIFLDPVAPAKFRIPELHLEIIKGRAEQPTYRITKDRLLVGCLPEVQDREGRLVRKNNVVFPHDGDEINATVGNMHARIWFDYKRQEFRVMDESSRSGTRIIREGYTIEVPAENPRGVGLHTGDEVYFGQACLRFTLLKK